MWHTDLIILVASGVILPHSQDEIEYCHECTDCIWIPAEHDIAKADIIVSLNMTGCDTSEWSLYGQVIEYQKCTKS